MAIERDEVQTTEQTKTAPVSQQQSNTPKPAAPQQSFQNRTMNNKTTSLLAMTGRIPAPMAATPEAEAMRVFLESIKQLTAEGIVSDYNLSLVAINPKENNLSMSVLVLVLQAKINGQVDVERGLSFHTLLLADTMRAINPPQINILGHNITVPRPASDAYDSLMRSVIVERLQLEFRNVPTSKMFEAEGTVIPRGYAYKNLDQVRATLLNALKASASCLISSTEQDLDDLVLDQNARSLNVQVRVSTRQNQSTDEVGEPIRTDVRIELTESTGSQVNQASAGIPSLNSGDQVAEILHIGGFFDLLYDPVQGAGQQNPYAVLVQNQAGQQLNQQLYRPNFVITEYNASELRTLPGQLLALATIPALIEGNVWFSDFMPSKGNAFDMHDIGAIGHELNLDKNPSGIGERIDTRGTTFNEIQLTQLLAAFLRPDPIISLDVEECGPSTYWNSVFLAAAQGSDAANQAIFYAADKLTNGAFSKIHNGAGLAVQNNQNRIHLGYYTDKQGMKRDLRDIDYLSILNTFGANDAGAIQDWSDSYSRVDYPQELRMDARWRLIDRATGGTAVLTGYAKRVSFDVANFVIPFLTAVKNTGFVMKTQTPLQDISGQPRSTASYLQAGGLGSGVASGLYTRGFNQNANVGAGQPTGGFGRWR